MVKTLEKIDSFCRKNNIVYSLCWGTMIGAIRHQGFIPWDDDIDLMMPRNDYNRFINEFNDPDYNIYTPQKDRNCIQVLTKVYNNNTRIFFNNHHKSLFGVWVSIFPYDNAPDGSIKLWEFKRNFWMNLYHFKTVRYLTTDSLLRRIGKFALKIPLLPFSSFWINKRIEKCLTKFNNQTTKMYCIWPGDTYSGFDYYSVDLFEECIDVTFDGINTRIIKGYDIFLRLKYGDYMQFPPESERAPKHDYRAYYI